MSQKRRKQKDLVRFLVGLIVLVAINYISSTVFTRFDLTNDNRYSLNDATVNQMESLDDVIFVRVYLEGEMPAGYRRLRNAIQETLDEFRVYAGDNLQYTFVDPSESGDPEIQDDIYRELTQKGLTYTSISRQTADKRSEQIVFPGAIIQKGELEVAVQLLKSQVGAPEEVSLNNSIQQLEFELSTGISKAVQGQKQVIGLATGHGELDAMQTADLENALSEYYTVARIPIDGNADALSMLDSLKIFDALLFASPTEKFSEKDKYLIDQYMMGGGKLMWFVDRVDVPADSLRKNNITMATPRDLNLDDLFFKYGIRLNPVLVMDLQALPLPVVTGMVGNQPRQEMFPWYYSPMVMAHPNHPISTGLDATRFSFTGNIDPVGSDDIAKTPLLLSSEYSKPALTPHRVALNMLRQPPNERQYDKGRQTLAMLTEGSFQSLFSNRLPQVEENPEFKFKDSIAKNKMIVVADGDFVKNAVDRKSNTFYDMGYYPYTRHVYANKAFILNSLNYLLDDSGLIMARTKEFKLHLLDKQRIKTDANRLKVLNVALPVIPVVLLGLLFMYLRRRRYAS